MIGPQPEDRWFSARELAHLDLPERPWLVEKLLLPRAKMLITGGPKRGKSLLAAQLAYNLASGKPFLGRFDVPNPLFAVYLQYEVTLDGMHMRLAKQGQRFEPLVKVDFGVRNQPKGGIEAIEQYLVDACVHFGRKPDVVIVDPLINTYSGELDENNAQQMQAHLDKFNQLIDYFKCGLVVVHHNRKGGGRGAGPNLEQSRGSIHITAWPNTIITIGPHDKGDVKQIELSFDLRDAEDQSNMVLELDPETLTFHSVEAVSADPAEAEAIEQDIFDEVLQVVGRERAKVVNALVERGWSESTARRRYKERFGTSVRLVKAS